MDRPKRTRIAKLQTLNESDNLEDSDEEPLLKKNIRVKTGEDEDYEPEEFSPKKADKLVRKKTSKTKPELIDGEVVTKPTRKRKLETIDGEVVTKPTRKGKVETVDGEVVAKPTRKRKVETIDGEVVTKPTRKRKVETIDGEVVTKPTRKKKVETIDGEVVTKPTRKRKVEAVDGEGVKKTARKKNVETVDGQTITKSAKKRRLESDSQEDTEQDIIKKANMGDCLSLLRSGHQGHDQPNYNISRDADSASNNMHKREDWDEARLLSQAGGVPIPICQIFINLLMEGSTLPFIARYRRGMVGNMLPDRIQELYEKYEIIQQMTKKANSILTSLKNADKLTKDIEQSIINARSLGELELIYAPLKSRAMTFADKARNLGLEGEAIKMLNGQYVNLNTLCRQDVNELSSPTEVETQIMYIVADIIYKDAKVMDHMRQLKSQTCFTLQSTRSKVSPSTKDKMEDKPKDKKSDPEIYKLYFDFKSRTTNLRAHQVLAINRGEKEKVLSVKIIVPDWFHHQLEKFCLNKWRGAHIVKKSLTDAYTRLIKPWLSRQIKSELSDMAEKESIRTFTKNVERLLLTEPVKNRNILGLDPGYRAGCKVGVIAPDGRMLETHTIFPFLDATSAAYQLRDIIQRHNVEVIALGDGKGCRETESWIRNYNIIEGGVSMITGVPETGASIYSVSKKAAKDDPDLDCNVLSALSIARRVLDPLGEYVKIDPKNLGVGMYQHDVTPKLLDAALASAVEKVVSLVGADINTASHDLLRRIAGLSDARAKAIIKYRETNNGFRTRAEIQKVTGIGKVTFVQCAGFLKIVGGPEPLDNTIVHPESYGLARTFAKNLDINIKDICKSDFPSRVASKLCGVDVANVARTLGTDIFTLELIMAAFRQVTHEDIIKFTKPVYSSAVKDIEHITKGMVVDGVVRNVTTFGCFVDCGIGQDGLIHRTNMGQSRWPKLGERVSVRIMAPPEPKKIQLKLERILS